MTSISISALKLNPAKAIDEAEDFPIAIQKRSKTQAYLVSEKLYERLISYIENYIDAQAVKTTDFKKGKDFEKVARELGI